jgi:hypothetical protein
MQQDAQARSSKPDIPYSQQISLRKLYAFLAIVAQMGHDQKSCMKLYWTKEEICCISFYSGMMPCVHFLKILKYLHDSQNSPIQDGRS